MGIKKREKGWSGFGSGARGRHASDVDQNRYNARSFSGITFEMYFSPRRIFIRVDKNTNVPSFFFRGMDRRNGIVHLNFLVNVWFIN